MINIVPGTTPLLYKDKVRNMKPLAYWPLDDVNDNDANNYTDDGPLYDGRRAGTTVAQNRYFYGSYCESFWDSRVDVYGADLNANFTRQGESSIALWLRLVTKQDWTPSAIMRVIHLRINDAYRFAIQIGTGGTLDVFRIASGVTSTVSHDFSATKPLEWISVVITTTNNQFKLFINGVQSGSTQTPTPRMNGALDATTCVIGASDISNANACRNVWMAHVALFNRALPQSDITAYATPPPYLETVTLTHSTVKEWDIFALYGVAGSSMAVFAEDVDSDGQKEAILNIGRRPRFVAVKQNDVTLWDTLVDNTQVEGLRFPQLRNNVLYYGWTNHACAINILTGAVVWNKTPMASPPASGLGGMNQSSVGLVMAVGNQLDILDYATGNSIGGNFPVTLPFDQWEQSLAVGIFGTVTEVIICNDNFNNMICFNIDGTIRFQKGPLVGTVNWVNENDWYEFFDIQNSGNRVLALIGDDDANTTQPALEGNEFHIYGPTGTQLDKYDDGILTGGLQYHCYAWPNGGRVAFTHESDYANRRITMLDHLLNVVWFKNVGTPYEGDQCILLDVDGDGHPEILYSTEVFSENGGFRVCRWQDGEPVLFKREDSPIQVDDIVDAKGAAVNINVSHAPYFWDPNKFIQFTHRTTDSVGHEKIFLHKWTP